MTHTVYKINTKDFVLSVWEERKVRLYNYGEHANVHQSHSQNDLRGVAGGDGELGCLCGKAGTGHLCDCSAHSSGCVVNGYGCYYYSLTAIHYQHMLHTHIQNQCILLLTYSEDLTLNFKLLSDFISSTSSFGCPHTANTPTFLPSSSALKSSTDWRYFCEPCADENTEMFLALIVF